MALDELFAYYRGTQAMWTTAYWDATLVEPLGEIMDATWFLFLALVVDILAGGRGLHGKRRARIRAH